MSKAYICVSNKYLEPLPSKRYKGLHAYDLTEGKMYICEKDNECNMIIVVDDNGMKRSCSLRRFKEVTEFEINDE